MQLKEYAVDTTSEEVKMNTSVPANDGRSAELSALAAASRAKIASLLSNDSEKFMSQRRQQGGQ